MRLSDSFHFGKLPKAPMAAVLCAPTTLGTLAEWPPAATAPAEAQIEGENPLRRGPGTTWACPVSSKQEPLELLQESQGRIGLCGLAETRVLAWW